MSDQQNLDMQYSDGLVSKIDNFLKLCISKTLGREAPDRNILLLGPNIVENEANLRLQAKNLKIDKDGNIKMQLCLYQKNSNADYNFLFRKVIIPAINNYVKSNQDYEVIVEYKLNSSLPSIKSYPSRTIFTSESLVVLTFKEKDLNSENADEFEA